MESVKKFNELHGKKVTRAEIQALLVLAVNEEQTDISGRLKKLLKNDLEFEKIHVEIENEAVEEVPKSVLAGIPLEQNDHEAIFGLGKPVSSDEIYQMITDLMINTIEKVGHLPWQKGWKGTGIETAKNYVTQKPYTGINAFMLSFERKFIDGKSVLEHSEEEIYYLTFKQIEDQGATLKKGSKGKEVVYYNFVYDYKDESNHFSTSNADKFSDWAKENKLSAEQVEKNLKRFPILKYYNVFSANDCEGLKPIAKKEKQLQPIEAAQAIIDNYPNKPKYVFGTDKASYIPILDKVSMPTLKAFKGETEYYSTFFHEIIHSTGHESRLSRDFSGRFGDNNYAFEELIAELGAVFLCAESGILFHTIENSAKYLKSWNEKLVGEMKTDIRFFAKAAAQSQKATNFVLNPDEKGIPAYVKELENKKAKEKAEIEAKKKVDAAKTTEKQSVKENKEKTKIIGYMLLDNISGELVASKKALQELKQVFSDLEENANFSGSEVFVYEIEKVNGKNTQGKRVSVDWTKPEQIKTPAKTEEKQTIPNPEQIKVEPVKVDKNGQTALFGSAASKVQKIGTAQASNSQFFTVAGEVGKFLQAVERKPVHSVVITMDGSQGAGKTTTLYKFMDAFASPGNRCLFISGEEHPSSSLAIEKTEKYLSPEAIQHIDTVGEVESTQELYDLIAPYEIIFIDSWQKLLRMVGTIRLDEDLRKRFNGKVFVIIFQQTTDGKTKGGAEVVFDGDIIIKMVKEPRFSDNYAYFDKNRYTKVPIENLRYNIASGTTYNPNPEEAPEPEPNETTPIGLGISLGNFIFSES